MEKTLPRTRRRLAAVLVADVVGSSRLMGHDEQAALTAIQALVSEVIEPAARRSNGRLVKTMGDGAMLEFASPVDAVLCAVAVQEAASERAMAAPLEMSVRLRIGINLGDIMGADDGDIYGDTVNIAVRLEAVADPGGISISAKVFEELEGKLSLPFEDRGTRHLKNIARPVRVYAIKGSDISSRGPKGIRPGPRLMDRPSIAVLPFINLTGDPEHEYFADGIADDLIMALARSRWLFVMARSSSFAFKGRAIETDEVARRLGVRYLLSGTVRKSAARVRISAQLIEAETGGSIWAQRYDRNVDDILLLQDQIVEEVAGAIEPELLTQEGQRGAEHPQSLTAWDLVRRGMWEFHKVERNSHHAARQLFLQAIDADPYSADGYIWLARAEAGLVVYGWADHPEATLRNGMNAALRALQIDDQNPYAHYAVAFTHAVGDRTDAALMAAQRAISLSPSFALGHLILGAIHLHDGRAREAIEHLEQGVRLSPYDQQNFTWLFLLALSYYFAGEHEKALAAAKRALVLRPYWAPALKVAALCCAAMGNHEGARATIQGMELSADRGTDLTWMIGRFNPAWSAQFEASLRALMESAACA